MWLDVAVLHCAPHEILPRLVVGFGQRRVAFGLQRDHIALEVFAIQRKVLNRIDDAAALVATEALQANIDAVEVVSQGQRDILHRLESRLLDGRVGIIPVQPVAVVQRVGSVPERLVCGIC